MEVILQPNKNTFGDLKNGDVFIVQAHLSEPDIENPGLYIKMAGRVIGLNAAVLKAPEDTALPPGGGIWTEAGEMTHFEDSHRIIKVSIDKVTEVI